MRSRETSESKPEPEPKPSRAIPERGADPKRGPRRAGNTYACRTPEPPPSPRPTQLPIEKNQIALTRQTCKPGAYAGGSHGALGSWTIQVQSFEGNKCVFERMDEIEGGYTVLLCKVAVPFKLNGNWMGIVPNESCTLLRRGNLLTERDGPYEDQLPIPGTNFLVSVSNQPGKLSLPAPDPTSPRVTLGATVRIAYQLYEDTEYTIASPLQGATGEIEYRHGAGEVGQAIERVFSTNSSANPRSIRMGFRAEVAQGIRDKLPGFAVDAQFCADIAVMHIRSPATAPHGPVPCPTGEQWFCQLGPTSVDNTASARGCGCGLEFCPNYGFRWTIDSGEKWPDGSHKLKYDCIDDNERIRRARLGSQKK